jgi:hypothetical protein
LSSPDPEAVAELSVPVPPPPPPQDTRLMEVKRDPKARAAIVRVPLKFSKFLFINICCC